MFYNHNPAGPYHGTLYGVPNVKGHAVSPDLVRWEDRPIALWPTAGGPDEQGTWTGCVVDDDGMPTFVYTGASGGARYSTGGRQRPCLAVAVDDDLEEWEKRSTPIVEQPPPELDIVSVDWEEEFRDHCVWRDDDEWFQLIGSGIDGAGGAALLYRSEDLWEWEYCNPILVGDAGKTGSVWECPELFPLADRHLLHVSCNSTVYYFLGEFDGRRFRPDRRGRLDYGDFYAPQTFHDDGRRIAFGWIRNGRDTTAQWNAGWAGSMSLPRVLDVDADGRLTIEPLSTVETLRLERLTRRCVGLSDADGTIELDDVAGATLEFDLEIQPGDASEVGLLVRRSPDGEEETKIRYLPTEDRLVVDRSNSSRSAAVDDRPRSMLTDHSDDGTLNIRAFLDRSVLELFVDGRRCLTTRVYPARADSTGVALYAEGGRATASLSAWRMASIW